MLQTASCTDFQQFPVSLTARDATGNIVTLNGAQPPVISDPTVCKVTNYLPTASGITFNVVGLAAGTAKITITAQGNTGPQPWPDFTQDIVQVTVVADPRELGNAASFDVAVGTPVDQTPLPG